jgi:exodeoxyribonuclease V alpha subunit
MRGLDGAPPDRNARELVGVVQKIVWMAPSGEAVIAKLCSGEVVKGALAEIDGATDGSGDGLAVGIAYRFLGRWDSHPKYGHQFAFSTYVKDTPHTRAGVVKYLMDEAPNVGRRRADQLWEAFGPEAVAVLRSDPGRVVAAGILTEAAAQEASEALAGAAALERTKIDLFSLFAGRGFPGKLIQSCIDEWGARAAASIRRDAFTLLTKDMPGCGFRRSDRLYIDLGGRPDRLKRQMLCAWNALREDGTGDTWVRRGAAVEAIQRQCAGAAIDPDRAIMLGLRSGWLARRETPAGVFWLAEWGQAEAERRVADNVRRLLGSAVLRWPTLPEPAAPPALTDHQRDKAAVALSRPLGILAGTPGTGKTFAAAAIIREVVGRYGTGNVAVVAPTGKAAVRCTAAMNRYGLDVAATTIHRRLEIGRGGRDGKGWEFKRNRDNPLPQRFVVVDEVSMLDTSLAASLLEACADGTHVLLVGDPYQLPPVGHGAPLRDLIAAGVPCGELEEIRRNSGTIVEACAEIKRGKRFQTVERFDPDAGHNLRHVELIEPAACVEALRALLRQFRASRKFDPIWDVQILTALNIKSDLARVPLNKMLQAELNPDGKSVEPNPFRLGDKIICLKNSWMQGVELKTTRAAGDAPADPDSYVDAYSSSNGHAEPLQHFLANGDVGKVMAVGAKVTVASFPLPDRLIRIPMRKVEEDREAGEDGAEVKGAGSDFALAYAITVHKAQGSEWPVAVVMIDRQAGRVACREHHYTAISRAQRLCVLIGPRAVADQQCRVMSLPRRKTFLKELLA